MTIIATRVGGKNCCAKNVQNRKLAIILPIHSRNKNIQKILNIYTNIDF